MEEPAVTTSAPGAVSTSLIAMVVVDGEIEKMFVEKGFADNCPDDPFEVSDADTMLAYLKSQ